MDCGAVGDGQCGLASTIGCYLWRHNRLREWLIIGTDPEDGHGSRRPPSSRSSRRQEAPLSRTCCRFTHGAAVSERLGVSLVPTSSATALVARKLVLNKNSHPTEFLYKFTQHWCLSVETVNERTEQDLAWCERLYEAKARQLILYGGRLGLSHGEAEDVLQVRSRPWSGAARRPNSPSFTACERFETGRSISAEACGAGF